MKRKDRRKLNGRYFLNIAGILGGILVGLVSQATAVEINKKLSITGLMAGAYQYQQLSDTDVDNSGRGAFVFQPAIDFTPTDNDTFFAKFGFAAGNGLNEITPFVLAPWAAALEDDVTDINGSERSYLLTAWYKHTFQMGENARLGITGGLIDATDYLDGNAFANDEYTQFMNEALVNSSNGFLPSFDLGGAAEFEIGNFSINGVIMNIGENDDGDNYNYYGIQLAYSLTTAFGQGNYRLLIDATSQDFLDVNGMEKERLVCAILSFDQEFGDILGAWIRMGRQDDKAEINYQNLMSGGINISGKLWGRENDNFGIGYAYLDGGNTDLESSQVAETYVRFVLNEFFALTVDVQYMKDQYDNSDDPRGFIYGLRLTAEF